MQQYLDYLKNPFIAGILSGTLITLLAYLDNQMNDREFDKGYFLKVFIIVFILVTSLVYFSKTNGGLIQKGGGNITTPTIVKKLNTSGLDVYTDAPDF